MAFVLGRQQIFLELDETTPFLSDINELMSNSLLSKHFLSLAREVSAVVDVSNEDILKSCVFVAGHYGGEDARGHLQKPPGTNE